MRTSNNIHRVLIFIAIILSALSVQPVHAAATWTVNSNADPGDGVCDLTECTLREAAASSAAGDTVDFNLTNPATITLSSEIALSANQTISGPGADKLTISGNNATRVFNIPSGTAAISNITISNGNTTSDGGGIYVLGKLTLNGVVLSNNNSTGANGGGGIYIGAHGALTINNSVFSDNTASKRGGGIANFASANPLIINNSTFSANAANGGNGGGVFSFGVLAIYNSTFSGNTSTANGSGVYNGIGVLTLKNSIIANGNNVDCFNGATTKTPAVANNLIENNATGLNTCGTPTMTFDPLLSALGNYGDSTPTFGLLPGSPAINAGDSSTCLSTDQRGSSRFGVCDIGAFESQGFTFAVSGGNNQSANINTAFAAPLAISVTASNATEPVDGGQITFTAPLSGAAASITGSPATISAGGASVTATANNTAGAYIVTASANGGTSINFNLTNGIPAPDTQIDTQPSSPTNNVNASFTFSSTDITATFECALDGPSFSACISGQTYSGLSDGSHTFQVRAKNLAGDVDPTPASYTWTIDATPPDTQIDSHPSNPGFVTNGTFTFSSPDSTATFECKFDGAVIFTACSNPQPYSGLALGPHTFQVRATDSLGNTDATPASYTWTIYTLMTTSFTSQAANDGTIVEIRETSDMGGTVNSAAATLLLGDSALRQQYRSILSFSTASLPDTAIVTAVTINIKQQTITGGGDPFSIFNGLMIFTKNGFFGTAATLQAADFQAAASNTQGPFLPIPVSNWYSINLANGAYPFINTLSTFQSGLTQFRLQFSLDDNNNGVANNISFSSGNAVNAADRPTLQVQYYVP